MKSIFYSALVFLSGCFGFGAVKKKPEHVQPSSSFFSLKAKFLDGKEIDFSQFKGKKVLVVNTASKCGFTPQYKELQAFHEKYGEKVVLLGFPSNQFGGQEPGSSEEIKEFCQKNFGVTFQMIEKVDVKGSKKHPVYKWLTEKDKNGWNEQEPGWNFCKYLISEKGELVGYYGSAVKPFDKEIIEAIEK